jgi:DNA repair protein RecO
MAYATYITEAIVCGSKDNYTSDRAYLLFTERAGMLWASARSVRTEASKQRYALQVFSIIRVSLVKGKTGWRIGSVEAIGNPFLRAHNRETRGQVQMVVLAIRRFLQGEEPAPHIFADARTALELMPTAESARAVEHVFMLRFLHALGYVTPDTVFADVLEGDMHEKVGMVVPPLGMAAIDRALGASHL